MTDVGRAAAGSLTRWTAEVSHLTVPADSVPAAVEARTLRAVAAIALGATLAIAPFESLLIGVQVAGNLVTELELIWGVAIVAWLGVIARERRRADIPRFVAITLVALLLVGLLSALMAGQLAEPAFRFALRGAAFALLFVAVADLVRTEGMATALLGALLAGAAIAALIGLAAAARGTSVGLIGWGRDYTVAGQLRVSGPFDYPTTASMAWEATLLAALPLAFVVRARWRRIAAAVGLVLIGAAMILTFTRGALIGALAGLAVIVVAAAVARRWRLAPIPLVAGATLVVASLVALLGTGLPVARLTAEADRDLYGARYAAPADVALAAGSLDAVPITIANAGPAPWTPTGEHPFRLSYHWLDPQTSTIRVLDGARTDLTREVAPGESIALQAVVAAPERPGSYLLAWDIVHEGVAWLSEKGIDGMAMTVRVGDPGGAAMATISGPIQVWPNIVLPPERAELWRAALAMIREDPLLGVGPGNFRLTYGSYLGLSEWDTDIHANDLYLELGATTGLLGLGLFLLLVASVVLPGLLRLVGRRMHGRHLSRAPTLSKSLWLLSAGTIAAIVAFHAHGVVDHFLGFASTGVIFWAVLGIGSGLGQRADVDA